jgi:hypothetical protein
MELSITQEATSCAATWELPSILWNRKVHYHIHKSFPLVPMLNQTIPVNTTPHAISPRSIFILSTHLCRGLCSGPFPSGFPTNNLYGFLVSHIRATGPAHLILLNLIILIILGKEYNLQNFSLISFLHPPDTSSLFGLNIHSTCPPLMSETKLHTRTEPQAKL